MMSVFTYIGKLEWLIVHPDFFRNGPGTGNYRVIEDMASVVTGKFSRFDVADFMLKQLQEPNCFRKKVLLTY